MLDKNDKTVEIVAQVKIAYWLVSIAINQLLALKNIKKNQLDYKNEALLNQFNINIHTFLWKSYKNVNQDVFNCERFLELEELYAESANYVLTKSDSVALISNKIKNKKLLSPMMLILNYWKNIGG